LSRLFLALKAELYVYDSIKADFEGVIEGKWTREENLHLTLCFFGDFYTPDEVLELMPKKLEKIAPPELVSLSYFKHNNILFAQTQSEELLEFQARLSKHFSRLEAAKFVPHVTLMRMKKISDTELFEKTLDKYAGAKLGKFSASVHLMQSNFTPEGVRYESLIEFNSNN
jgi:2'-5' RNA ligase